MNHHKYSSHRHNLFNSFLTLAIFIILGFSFSATGMQNQNPSEDDSTNKAPSDDTPHPTNNDNNNPPGESLIMKTVRQVLEELGGSRDDSDGGVGDGTPVAVALEVGGGGDGSGGDGGGVGGGPPVAMEASDGGDEDNDNEHSDSIGDSVPVAVAVKVGGRGGDNSGGGATVTVSVALSDGDYGGSNGSGGSPVAVAVAVGGGSTVMESVVVGTEGVQGRKRKTPLVRDPPTGRPTCPLCQKEFQTWKGAFGHMRAHPDRDYRGFFKPPVFGSPSSTQDQPPSDGKGDDSAKKSTGEDNTAEKGSASLPVRVPMFDLNELIEEDGSSHAAEPAEDMSTGEGKGSGFDLNEMPSAED
ncbi:hypothetical protein AAZX31_11G083200 [Glycine max]|uniref:C2H2-type domain-containing protein n=1 Tax=Glycine soja TaxID=3848 RepID=A0A445HZ54_GLYSO|nr:AT-rich interactive domain-containing protein 1B-like isoform X2 [Glycine soja]KAH1224115.1 Zinc finger protein ZAT3 [Glycine max]RZB78942.1 hypothetical protein D0Y65_029355 [Glycine soja]